MSWHSCKVISLFAESVEGPRWALHPHLPLRDLNWQLYVMGGDKEIHQKRVRTALLRRLYTFLPCSTSFRWRWKSIWGDFWFFLHHRKWNVELPTVQWQRNPWSLFLSTYTPTRAQTACKNSVWGISLGIGRALQELPPHHSSSSDHRHLTAEILLPPRFSGSQTTHWFTENPSLHSP